MRECEELREVRKKIFLTAYSVGIGHLASAFSAVEILYTLYKKRVLNYDPQVPLWEDRDRLVLSKGHASLALYVMLQETGFLHEEELKNFCKPGSCLGGEPNMVEIPGVEASTGSLGHGLSIAMGMALGQKLNGSTGRTFAIIGDGECQEGCIWEAAMFAARFQLDNLTAILDYNGIQKMDMTKEIMGPEYWKEKWNAFGWEVVEIDGHSVDEIEMALKNKSNTKKPYIILAHTVKGKGISIMENDPKWHFKMPNKRELRVFMEELKISQEELDICR